MDAPPPPSDGQTISAFWTYPATDAPNATVSDFFLSLLLKLLPSKYNVFSQNSQTQHFWYPNENDWHWKWSGPTPPGRVSGVGLPLLR